MNVALIVVTPKREGARRPINSFLAHRVVVRAKLCGSRLHGRSIKLKVHTNYLTGVFPTAGRSAASLAVRGQGNYDLLNNEAVAAALAEGHNIDMRD